MKNYKTQISQLILILGVFAFCNVSTLNAQKKKKPNILVIWGDDIGQCKSSLGS